MKYTCQVCGRYGSSFLSICLLLYLAYYTDQNMRLCLALNTGNSIGPLIYIGTIDHVYTRQGDRTRNVGIVDHEYVVHKGIQTLGGSDHDTAKVSKLKKTTTRQGIDVRSEIRRQSTWELEIFKERWNQAIADDKHWIDPFTSDQ